MGDFMDYFKNGFAASSEDLVNFNKMAVNCLFSRIKNLQDEVDEAIADVSENLIHILSMRREMAERMDELFLLLKRVDESLESPEMLEKIKPKKGLKNELDNE